MGNRLLNLDHTHVVGKIVFRCVMCVNLANCVNIVKRTGRPRQASCPAVSLEVAPTQTERAQNRAAIQK